MDKNTVKEQLKTAGMDLMWAPYYLAGAVAQNLDDDEIIHAACLSPNKTLAYLITNKRLLSLRGTKLDYACAHSDVTKVQVEDSANTMRITTKDDETYDVVLGKQQKAHDNYVAVVDKGLHSKVERGPSLAAHPSLAASPGPSESGSKVIGPLEDRGEKLLASNINPEEKIAVKLKGAFGEGFVVTDKRIYILKWGFQTGHTFGPGECTAFELLNVTGLQFNKHATSGFVEVLSPATQANPKLSYWGDRNKGTSAQTANYAVAFTRDAALFQEAVNIGREAINQAHRGSQQPGAGPGELDQLEKLADLKDKGIITEQEFQAKKRQLLGL